jgi:hypothetical protein
MFATRIDPAIIKALKQTRVRAKMQHAKLFLRESLSLILKTLSLILLKKPSGTLSKNSKRRARNWNFFYDQ